MPLKDYDKPAEKALIAFCRAGLGLQISNVRPTKGNDENTIRAGLIRELLLGTEDCKLPAQGLHIWGAWIDEHLSLTGEAVPVPLGLLNCTLTKDVILQDCTLSGLYLTGTRLPAMLAQRLRCSSSLHLRDGFEASGPVDLGGAKIAGDLDCNGDKFLAKDVALRFDTITVGASMLLRNDFEAKGKVDRSGANITGQLDCARSKFTTKPVALHCDTITVGANVCLSDGFAVQGEVNLAGAKIGGQLACRDGKFWAEPEALTCYATTVGVDAVLSGGFEARGKVKLTRAEIAGNLDMSGAKLAKGLIASGMRLRDGFFWRGVQGDGITVELIDAQVGTLHDPSGSWDPVKKLCLSSFRYDRIDSDMDVQERLDWLAKHGDTVSRLTPAPYVQLANVLRQQGFAREAAQVLILREDKQRAVEWDAAITGMDGTLRREWAGYAHVFLHFLSWVFKWIFGYGHQPTRVLRWIAIIFAVTFCFAEQTHRRGQFAPTSAVVLKSPEWLRSFPNTPLPADSPLWRAQLDAWVKTEPGRDYESFSAWLYALDLFIPLDALGQ